MKKEKAITLIALVITIIILLILAGITIGTLLGENGIITRATRAKEEYKIAEAREKLSLVLTDAGIEKRTNIKYNQDAFLDQFIKDNLEGSKIKGDIAIVDGYAFSLDRSVPKIGEYLGEEKDLVFPDLKVDTQISSNNDSATITITAQESKNGISKIEVILDGDVVHTYDNYNNKKEEIIETYTTDKNGTYTVKVYSKLINTETTKVEGVISPIMYEPNGSEQYAKEFQVKVSVSESNEKVKSIKYQWTNSTAEPVKESFIEGIENGGTVSKSGLTGKYYLWTLLETESGATRTGKSEAFYFDNTGPTAKLTSTAVSASSFTLKAEATDADVKTIAKYEFYMNGKLVNTQTTSAETASYTVTGMSMGTASCYVKVYDSLGNEGKSSNWSASTKLYTWERYSCVSTAIYKLDYDTEYNHKFLHGEFKNSTSCVCVYDNYSFCKSTGKISGTGNYRQKDLHESNSANPVGWYYINGSNSMIYFVKFRCAESLLTENRGFYYDIRQYKISNDTEYTKGTTQYTNVTSTNPTAYPTNNKSGSYWYVSKGVQ